ncbi:MAG: acyltransferase [Burkholderiaceae bacterium]
MAARTDIQALRGLAVLLVLFDHAKIGPFEAGYLGVDVFFVISGYLDHRHGEDGLADGTFGFASFYFRRAKRLLPAAYLIFAVTAAIALRADGHRELGIRRQPAGAVTFTGNVVLWMQTGYFEGAAELKPLLHVWSLSIEEQYYLLLPASMALVPRRFWRAGAAAILAGSLGAVPGGGAAVRAERRLLPASHADLGTRRRPRWPRWACSRGRRPGRSSNGSSAGPDRAGPVAVRSARIAASRRGGDDQRAATLVVVLRKHPACEASLRAAGSRSSATSRPPLYLVHWPIFAFLNCAYGGAGQASRVVAMVLAILVALVLVSHRRTARPAFLGVRGEASRRSSPGPAH